MDVNDLRSAVTLFSFVLFLGLMAWTWWPRNRAAHDDAALLPFTGEGEAPAAAGARPMGDHHE